MRVDDFVCLGRTVPEASTKYGTKVCMAGYSEEMRSLLRVYPLEVANPIHARSRCALELVRNAQDSRAESWKLKDRNDSILDVGPLARSSDVVQFLRAHRADSIDELNARRASLGVLEVKAGCCGLFKTRAEVNCPFQGTLFDYSDSHAAFGATALDIAPYLSFFDPAGKPHTLQIREWGVYEWIRRNRREADQVWKNLRVGPDQPTLLIVGNMNNRRNTWLVIKSFKFDCDPQRSIFDAIPDEEEAAWQACKSAD